MLHTTEEAVLLLACWSALSLSTTNSASDHLAPPAQLLSASTENQHNLFTFDENTGCRVCQYGVL